MHAMCVVHYKITFKLLLFIVNLVDPGEIEVIRILPGNEEMLRIRWNISVSLIYLSNVSQRLPVAQQYSMT